MNILRKLDGVTEWLVSGAVYALIAAGVLAHFATGVWLLWLYWRIMP